MITRLTWPRPGRQKMSQPADVLTPAHRRLVEASPGNRWPRGSSATRTESLLSSDREAPVVGEHGRVPAGPLGVVGGAAEYLAPPGRHVLPVLRADPAGEE